MQYGFFMWRPWQWGYAPTIGVMIPLRSGDAPSCDAPSSSFKGPSPRTSVDSILDMHSCVHDNLLVTAHKSRLQRSEDGLYHIANRTVDELVYLDGDGTRSLAYVSGNTTYGKYPSSARNYTMDITVESGAITVTSTVSEAQPNDPDSFWYSRAYMGVFMVLSRVGGSLSYQEGSTFAELTASQAKAKRLPPWTVPRFVYPTGVRRSTYSWAIGSVIDQTSELSEEEKGYVISTLLSRASTSLPVYSENLVFGDLSQDCADQAKALSINLSQFTYELTQMKTQVASTLQLLKGKASAKNLSSLYLSASYGYANTYRDIETIVAAVNKEMRTFRNMYTCRAQRHFSDSSPSNTFSFWRTSFFQKIYYSQSWNNPILDGLQAAVSSSIIPSLSDVWDYLPFSFVVNWFVDVNSALEAIDAKTFIATLPIRAVVETRKDFTEVDLSLLPEFSRYGIAGNAKFAHYRRTLRRSARLPYARFGESEPSNHWVEATALLTQART